MSEPVFHINADDEVFRDDEKVGYLLGDDKQLRMTRGNGEHRAAVEAWMESSPQPDPESGPDDEPDEEQSPTPPDGAQGEPATGVAVSPHETKAEAGPIVCPIPGTTRDGDKTPEVVAWWFKHHPDLAAKKYAGRKINLNRDN